MIGLGVVAAVVVVGGAIALVAGGSGEGGGAPGLGGDVIGPGGEATEGRRGEGDAGEGQGGGQGEGGGRGGASAVWVSEGYSDSQGLVTDGEVVCSTLTCGSLYCLDGATGQERLRVEVGGILTSPELDGDTLLVGGGAADRAGIHAYSLDGEERWFAPVEIGPADLLSVASGVVSVVDGLTTGELVGFDVATGEERWRAYTGDRAVVPTLIGGTLTDGERLYVGMETYDNGVETWLAAIDPATGQELWRAPLSPEQDGLVGFDGVAASEDGSTITLLAVTGDDTAHMVVVDTATGEVRRQGPLAGGVASVVQVDDTTLVTDGSEVVALDPDGQELWRVPTPIRSVDPSLSGAGDLVHEDGRVFLVGTDVFEVDPATGATEPVVEGAGAVDVAVVDDLVVVAGMEPLEARSLGT